MKKIIVGFALMLAMAGCDIGNEKIDTAFLQEPCPVCPEVVVPDPIVSCDETVYGQLRNELVGQIDTNNVKMNHYVDGVMIDESYAELFDDNGSLATQNPILLPAYSGTDLRHVLVVEFTQVR